MLSTNWIFVYVYTIRQFSFCIMNWRLYNFSKLNLLKKGKVNTSFQKQCSYLVKIIRPEFKWSSYGPIEHIVIYVEGFNL